jgi:WD40 repeat protein
MRRAMTHFLWSLLNAASRWAIIWGMVLTSLVKSAYSQDAKQESVPEDTCIMDLFLPAGATVNVDGIDYDKQRRMAWSGLKSGSVYRSQVTIDFGGKGRDKRTILVEGGRRVRLVLPEPTSTTPKIVPQTGHTLAESAQLTPDGRWLITGGHDGQVILWDARTGRAVYSFKGSGSSIKHVAISNDGRRILSTTWKETCVWDIATPEKPKFLWQERDSNEHTALSHDGRRVALVGSGLSKDTGVWNVDTGERISTFAEFSGIVENVVFSPDGRQVLMSQRGETKDSGGNTHFDKDNSILFDVATGRIIQEFERYKNKSEGLTGHGAAFSPDGAKIATGAGRNAIILWDATSGKKLLTLAGHRGWSGVTGVAFSPDGRQLLSRSYDQVILWDTNNGKKLQLAWCWTVDVAFIPEGPVAVAPQLAYPQAAQGGMRTWNVLSGKNVLPTISMQRAWINAVAFSPNGRQVALAALNNNTPLVWSGTTGLPQLLMGGSYGMVTQFASIFSPDSLDLAARSTKGHLESISCLAFSPDGRQILTGSFDTTAILWDTETGKQLHKLQGHRGRSSQQRELNPGALLRLLKYYTTGETDDLPKKQMQRVIESLPGFINCVAFSSDGKYAITGGADEKAIVWQCATGRKIRELPVPRKAATSSDAVPSFRHVNSVALSADGRLALIGSRFDPIVILWDVSTGKTLRTLEKDVDRNLLALTFSTDGQPLALTSS